MAVYQLPTGTYETRAVFAFRGGSFLDKRHFAATAVLVQHPKGDLLIDAGFGSGVAAHVAELPQIARAPYQAAKEKFRTMGRVQRRLTGEMNHLINQGHRLVDPRSWVTDAPSEAIEIGTIIEMDLNGAAEQFLIAGARDNQVPDSGAILPLPYNSPLGAVLLGRKPNDRFFAKINAHEQKIVIRAIRRPTLEEILQIFPALREA